MPGIGQGKGGGWKAGITRTEPSTFFKRLRATMGISIEKLAREIGVSEKTGRTYEKGTMPKQGGARTELQRLGDLHGVPFEEPEA